MWLSLGLTLQWSNQQTAKRLLRKPTESRRFDLPHTAFHMMPDLKMNTTQWIVPKTSKSDKGAPFPLSSWSMF
jgi:hypothetical protein